MSSVTNEPESTRSRAGLRLKHQLKACWPNLTEQQHAYIRHHVLLTVGDPTSFIRNIVGSLIASMAVQDYLISWPSLLPTLTTWLDHHNPNVVDGALNALAKICEDMNDHLDVDALGKWGDEIFIIM